MARRLLQYNFAVKNIGIFVPPRAEAHAGGGTFCHTPPAV
jgi:hypothetical protein